MEYVVYGVNHNNPCHRNAVAAWMTEEAERRRLEPSLVATEWDATRFLYVAEIERPLFRQACADEWPGISTDQLNALERGLGFEGDLHVDLFPETITLWLDDGNPQQVRQYAEDRLTVYRGYLETHRPDGGHTNVVHNIARRCREIDAEPVEHRRERDLKFAVRLMRAAKEYPGTWGAVIVGWDHAEEQEESMVRLLHLAGHRCDITSARRI